MEADFSGYASKAGLLCADGRTILAGAFKHQDQMKVPLVWQHGHGDVENVLGHAILENREDGVYAYGFFNSSAKADHARGMLEHGDINQMSIWANELVERTKKVLHGVIREVSLVLSGANPGALIENITIRHGDGDTTELDDEAIIYTGLELEHESPSDTVVTGAETTEQTTTDDKKETVSHAAGDGDEDEETVQDVYDSMSDKQKQVLHYMLGEAIEASSGSVQQSTLGPDAGTTTQEGNTTMVHKNVFESGKSDTTTTQSEQHVLTHDAMLGIVKDAQTKGSLKAAVEEYVLAHGIDDIDVLFPEARAVSNTPEFNQRRTEWVAKVFGGARKTPFSRIKTFSADITEDEARAKGYIKGDLKKEEFFSVAKRVTTPTTVYKKQKLDRDDVVDITDFDMVTWLRAEMRLMLDEEIARAILLGDGRDIASDDKINEQNIRPIASDHQLYAVTINVNIDDSNSSVSEVVDAIILNRAQYRGTGQPTFFTTETYISQFMVLKDGVGRRVYKNLDELAAELRVREIVPVEVMESYPDLVGIMVNMDDYSLGADRGGAVSMFDDFDIDYNQYKYLIETRCSGALTKLKSALVIRKVAAASVAVTPNEPTFNGTQVTIVNQTGVVYRNQADDSVMNAAGSPYAVAAGTARGVYAEAANGYYLPTDSNTTWTFRNRA